MPEMLCAPQVLSSTSTSHSFPSVSADELGFALSLFVAAGNRTLLASRPGTGALSEEEMIQRDHLFADLLVHGTGAGKSNALPYQASLDETFAVLWSEHKVHQKRDSICARVLGFHFLMVRTEGKAMEEWLTTCPGRPAEVMLDPAVVEGLATVRLDAGAGLAEGTLRGAVARAHDLRRRQRDACTQDELTQAD